MTSLENPNKPEVIIDAGVPVVCMEYNPRDPNSLVGGLANGQVGIDIMILKVELIDGQGNEINFCNAVRVLDVCPNLELN